MPEKKFILSGPETVTLAVGTIDKLIRAGDGDAALLYLYMRKTDGHSTPAGIAAAMGKSAGWVATATALLYRIGLIECLDETLTDTQPHTTETMPAEPEEREIRRYSAAEIKQGIDTNPGFAALVDEAKRCLGMLSPDALERLYGIYADLRLPAEVVMLLITHCISESRKKDGGGKPTMKYIEKAAYTWESKGIFSLDAAEKYLKAYEERKSAHGEIKEAMQIKDREFSATEKSYVDEWIDMGFGAETVAIAYDRTVVKTGKPAIGYMNSIIKSWHNKGLHTPKEIMEKDGKSGGAALKGGPRDNTKKFGDASPEEIKQMQKQLEKIKHNL